MKEGFEKSQLRFGYRFGFGTLTEIKNPGKEKTPDELRQEALLAGWSHGCPVAEDLTAPSSPYSLEYMLQRYTEVNYWFNLIRLESQMINRGLFYQLSRSTPRLPFEPVGKYNKSCVPSSHLVSISPMSLPTGYASPRAIIEILKLNGRPEERRLQAYGLVEKIVPQVKTPRELLAKLTENVVLLGVEPVDVLTHTLSTGILEEENCKQEYVLIALELEKHAPATIKAYLGLTAEEKLKHEIAEIPRI